jgi:histidinol-phosphatase (PHP family)
MKNLHTHTVRCGHAQGADREYVEAAIKAGFDEIGFSDHAPMIFPNDWKSNFRMKLEDAQDYADSIRRLQSEYDGIIKIRLGFEFEYYPKLFERNLENLKQYGYDYLILGQHFTANEYDAESHYSGGGTKDESVLAGYIEQVLEGLSTGEYLYPAHPDVIKYTGSDRIYNKHMREFCSEIKRLGYPLEFNLLGYSDHRNYPDLRFWKIAAETGNEVVIGCDAHQPEVYLDKELYASALDYLNRLGITPTDPHINK